MLGWGDECAEVELTADPAESAPSILRSRSRYPGQPADMRKSFDGLHALVQSEFRCDIRAGAVFLFLNRRRDRIKLLHGDRDGLVIWMKRLERGTFRRPRRAPHGAQVEMDATDLALLLSGIELTSVRRRRRYTCDAVPGTAPEPRGS